MITLPYAPLTRTELQSRVEAAKSRIAWYVSACSDSGQGFTTHDLDVLRSDAAVLRAYHEADMARCAS